MLVGWMQGINTKWADVSQAVGGCKGWGAGKKRDPEGDTQARSLNLEEMERLSPPGRARDGISLPSW